MKAKNSRGGQAVLAAVISFSLMCGIFALAVDLGWGYFRREAAQSAADAAASAVIQAALAGSPASQTCATNNVWCGSPAGTATSCPATAPATPATSFDFGCVLAARNGFLGSGNQTVTIQANTTSSVPTVPGTNVKYWATVRISETPTIFFGSPGGGNNVLNSTAIASAAIITTGGTISNECIYVLAPTGNSFNLSNAAQITTSACGIYVNSSTTGSNPAATVIGGAKVTTPSFSVVGGYAVNNGGCIDTPTGACNSLTPTTGATTIADPFVNLPSPTPAGTCNSGNFTNWQATAYTPSAGTYCGFTVGNGMSAVLGAGTYIINGGTFSIQGGSTITATGGVMIYLTNGATVNIANGANVTLSAESSGSYQGVLFYQDRTMTSPAASTFAGGANMNLSGSLYFPNALLNINNGANTSTEAVVAGSINFQGGETFKQATTASQTGLGTAGTSSVAVVQ